MLGRRSSEAEAPGRVLVTGAASGLGRAIARRFLTAGSRVLLTDVDEAGLAETAAELGRIGEVATLRLDVRSDADWSAALAWVEEHWQGLDLLVNNAGVAAGGRMERIPMADWDWILELNLKSVIRGCRTFIPLFKRQGHGYLANTASLAGLANAPMMAQYNTTKAAVISLSQTLRYELKPYGVGVSVLCPGFVRTNLAASMRSPDEFAVTMAQKLIDSSRVSADHVADVLFTAVLRQRFLVLTHPEAHGVQALRRISPGLLERVVLARWSKVQRRVERSAPAERTVA